MTNQHTDEFPAEPRQPYPGHPYQGQVPPGQVPFAPKPKARKGLTVILAVATFIVGLIIGGAAGSAGKGGSEPVAAVPAPATTEAAPAEKKQEKPKAEKPAKPVEAPETFGDGTYEVGVDIQPGRYKVTVPADSYMCLFQRLKDDTGDRGTIIAQDVKRPGAKASVTIKKSDGFFETSGCGEWTKQ